MNLYECLLASVPGLLPLQLLNTYVGCTVRNMQEVVSNGVYNYVVMTCQIVSSVFLMIYLLRRARKELAKHTRVPDIEADISNSS